VYSTHALGTQQNTQHTRCPQTHQFRDQPAISFIQQHHIDTRLQSQSNCFRLSAIKVLPQYKYQVCILRSRNTNPSIAQSSPYRFTSRQILIKTQLL